MKLSAFLFLLFISISLFNNALSGDSDSDATKDKSFKVKERWIEVPLDHFNLFDNRTWKMRYLVSDSFFIENGPIFLEIGGEWTIYEDSIATGPVYHLAKQHNGMLIASEHRYYGKSLPFSTDFSTSNLKYLVIEQALEDLAYLIEHFKLTVAGTRNSKVVVHGCSYAGMLATWFRLRFPHIADIGYASSAPLGVGLNFPEYFATVHDVYANVSVSCIDTIRNGFNITEKLLRTPEGRKKVKKALNLRTLTCEDVNDMSSVEILQWMMYVLNVQSDSIQYEEVSCLILRMNTDELDDFERLIKLVVSKTKDAHGCWGSIETEDEYRENRAWLYQTCTEVGFFQTLSRENSRHPFAIDLTVDESVEDCTEAFGDGITVNTIEEGIKRTNRRYGGRTPKVTKLLSVIGKSDPWSALAKIDESDQEAPVIILQGSHCVDTDDNTDSETLKQNQRRIRKIISNWLKKIS